jgi:hypothetical protein
MENEIFENLLKNIEVAKDSDCLTEHYGFIYSERLDEDVEVRVLTELIGFTSEYKNHSLQFYGSLNKYNDWYNLQIDGCYEDKGCELYESVELTENQLKQLTIVVEKRAEEVVEEINNDNYGLVDDIINHKEHIDHLETNRLLW